MKIANKISLSFLAVALVLVGIAAPIFYLIVRDDLKKAIYDNLNTAVASRTEHIETYLEMLKSSVRQLSKSTILESFLKTNGKEDLRQGDAFEAAMKRLKRTREANPVIAEFLLLNKAGKVAASSDGNRVGSDKSTDPVFLGGQKETYIKDVYYSEEYKEPLMAVSTPFLDSQTGELLGVLAAEVRMNGLNNILTGRIGMGDTGEIYIVNKDGFVVTPSRFREDVVLKQRVDSQNVKGLRLHKGREHVLSEKESGGGVFLDYRGVWVLGAHQYVPEMGWAILAEIDEKEAFRPLDKLCMIFLVVVFMTPLVAWLLGMLISKRITESICRLHEGAEIIGGGNLDYKVGIDSKDEVGQLSRAFDAMTANLKVSTTSVEKLNKEIAERDKMQAALRESEKRFMDVIYASADAVLIIDNQRFVECNEATVQMLGYSNKKELLMTHPSELSPPTQPDGRGSLEKANEMMRTATKEGFNRFEWIHRKANREDFPVEVSLTPIALKGRDVMHCHWRDITELKKIEQQRQETQKALGLQAEELDVSLKEAVKSREILSSMLDDNNQIRERLEQNIVELKSTQKMLVQTEKLASLGRLVSEMAHEVNNPLQIISGRAQLLLMDETQNEELNEKIRIIEAQCYRARDIIRRLLDFSRPSKGEVQEKDLKNIAEDAVKLLEHQYSLGNVKILRDYSAEELKVSVDVGQIEEVFFNILKNAFESIEGAGSITVSTSKGNGKARIAFKDTGCGMPAEVMENIFDPFYTTKETGTGLGLSVSYGIIKDHGGEIRYESEPGKGTTAIILFPMKG